MVAISFSVRKMLPWIKEGYNRYQFGSDWIIRESKRSKRQTIRKYTDRKYELLVRCSKSYNYSDSLCVQLYWMQRGFEHELLGTVRLSSIELIKMNKYGIYECREDRYASDADKYVPDFFRNEDTAYRDGFINYSEMYKWFKKRYDLSKEIFIVIRW